MAVIQINPKKLGYAIRDAARIEFLAPRRRIVPRQGGHGSCWRPGPPTRTNTPGGWLLPRRGEWGRCAGYRRKQNRILDFHELRKWRRRKHTSPILVRLLLSS